jgi:glycosyltransferase involved in cell wall biosynthesis
MGLARDSAYRGIGTYCRHVLAALAEEADLEVTALVPTGTEVPDGVRARRVLRVAPGRWAAEEHDLLLPLDLLRTPGDVLFSPGKLPPRWSPYPVVQTVHDLVPLSDPTASPSERREWQRASRRWQHAAAVVAVSAHTAVEATATLGLDSSRLHVVPHGVDAAFRPGPRGSTDPYLLFVGEYDPRKRHRLAFQVIGTLADRGLPHTLRVTGRIAPWYAELMAQLVADAPRPDRIELLGYQNVDALVRLYQQADVLLVTSSAEGFGLPAVEAMSCGTPVVTFDTHASQVVGDGGLVVPDGDVTAMADAVAAICTDETLRRDLRERAVRRAATFSWAESGRQHAAILRTEARRR